MFKYQWVLGIQINANNIIKYWTCGYCIIRTKTANFQGIYILKFQFVQVQFQPFYQLFRRVSTSLTCLTLSWCRLVSFNASPLFNFSIYACQCCDEIILIKGMVYFVDWILRIFQRQNKPFKGILVNRHFFNLMVVIFGNLWNNLLKFG